LAFTGSQPPPPGPSSATRADDPQKLPVRLVINTAKYLDGQPLVAVNPDPAHIDGVLLPFNLATAPAAG
jgi:hypothetical protein